MCVDTQFVLMNKKAKWNQTVEFLMCLLFNHYSNVIKFFKVLKQSTGVQQEGSPWETQAPKTIQPSVPPVPDLVLIHHLKMH